MKYAIPESFKIQGDKIKIMKIYLSLLLNIFLFLPENVSCQHNYKRGYVPFTGIIIEGNVPLAGRQDTVLLELKREFIYNSIGAENYIGICDAKGHFRFQFKNVQHPAKITLYVKADNRMALKDYYVEKNDSIFISFIKAEANYRTTFSGNGATKFNCLSELRVAERNALYTPDPSLQYLTGHPDSLLTVLENICKWTDTKDDMLLKILSNYTHEISPALYIILTNDIIGRGRKDICLMLTWPLAHADSVQKKKLLKLFTAEMQRYDMCKNYLCGYSEEYIEFLFRLSQKKLSFAKTDGRYSMKNMYGLLSRDYVGYLRDRVITSYLLREHDGISNSEYEYCLYNASGIVQNALYKSYIKNQLLRLKKGSIAYNFSLPDSAGKNVLLSQFKGRVVLMDFWFTGCYSCILFSKDLEKDVISKYADSSVAFVSINIDKEKNKWLQSLRSGQYTNSRSVNVYTNGMGIDHALLKYYNIQECPYLLLIDKMGTIYAAKPPRDTKKLCSMLDKALH